MTEQDDLGTLEGQGDRWRLIFTRRFAHPIEKVWRAVTEPEDLETWFPQAIIGERRTGATLRFVSSSGDGFDGELLVFDPPTTVEFMWGTDRLRIELQDEDGATRLTLTDVFGELGKAARDGAGWHECLERLGVALGGGEPAAWGDCWRSVHPRYVECFGPEASLIGPPPG
jgi:uncharacterized protein YndB with AHSA1/START domain